MTSTALPPTLKAAKILAAAGITSIEDLAACSEDELLGIKGFGPAALEQVRQLLGDHEVQLAGESAAELEDTTVRASTMRGIQAMPKSVQVHPFAALAMRLAKAVDDEAVAAKAEQFRKTYDALHAMVPARRSAGADPGDQPAPPEAGKSRVDEIGARRRAKVSGA